jgi:hypothetical protein
MYFLIIHCRTINLFTNTLVLLSYEVWLRQEPEQEGVGEGEMHVQVQVEGEA